jgi:hypothetical protein
MSDIDPNLPTETETVPPATEPPAQPPVEPTVPPIDYEKKFSESTRENQLLRDRLAAEEKARQELTKEPTDSDYRAAFPEWDSLDDFQKGVAKRSYNAERLAAASAQKAEQLTQERAWSTSIELAVSSDPALQGKEQAFRQFASQPKYRGTDMDLLVSAFLQKNPSAPTTPATPKPGLETGTGGPKEAPKPKTITPEELGALRTSDTRAYEQYIKTHDISDIDV